jgi:hypothetical protein
MSYERYADFTQVNGATVNAAYDKIASLKQQLAEAQRDAARYNELLYAVAKKHPDETRHETALRYIRQAEQPKDDQCHAMKEGE